MQSTSWETLGWKEQAGRSTGWNPGRNINNLRHADDTILMAEIKEEPKSLLMQVKEESEKTGLKLNIQKMKIMAFDPITSWQIGKNWKQWQTLSSWAPKSLQMVTAAMKLEDASWEESYDKPRQHIKKERHHLTDKCPYSQSYGFSSSHLWLWELDHKESWVPKNWCFQTVVLEKTLESPLDSKEIKPVNKGNQPWIFHWKDWCWSWSSSILATWCEELTHWKRPWCWERLKAGGEGGNRGYNS